MNKRDALRHLISASPILTDAAKASLTSRLISQANPLTDEEVENVGKLLAKAQRLEITQIKKEISSLDALVQELEKPSA